MNDTNFNDLIKIVGTEEMKPFAKVDGMVTKVSGKWYWKNDDRIVKVYDAVSEHFKWIYQKNVVVTHNGSFIDKKDAVELSHGRGMAHKVNCHKLDGVWYLLQEIVTINGKQYSTLSGDVVYTWEGWRLKGECSKLSRRFYPYTTNRTAFSREEREALIATDNEEILKYGCASWYVTNSKKIETTTEYIKYLRGTLSNFFNPEPAVVVTIDNEIIRYNDSDLFLDPDGQIYVDHVMCMNGITLNVLVDVDYSYDLIKDKEHAFIFARIPEDDMDEFPITYLHEVNSWVINDIHDHLFREYKRINREYNLKHTEEERYRANKNFGDAGDDENNAEIVDCFYERPRGGHIISDYRYPKQKSITFKAFGGMRYHFGVEIETCTGLLTNAQLKHAQLALISDGTIMAGEYATGVLHGDLGYKNLKTVMKHISENTFVDDTGAIHVHLSGANFNRMFSVYAIKLGIQVEKEMFQMQPRAKHPIKKHCAGISECYGSDHNHDDEIWSKSYSKIDNNNWREYLGDYVFGTPFTKHTNSRVELGKWTEGRYKWLNLVNCNSLGRFETIEFRSFASTTSFDKVYNNVLLAMAFVWFVENKRTRIDQGNVSLSEIVSSAYKRRYDLKSRLLNFIYERKLKFNRTDI